MLDWLSTEWFSISKFQSYHWDEPYFLYGIIAIPVLMWFRGVFHGRGQSLNVTLVSEPDTFSNWTVWLRSLFPISIFLSISLILVALARPQIINKTTLKNAEVIDIVMAIDVSESMLVSDLKPNRLSAAKDVAKRFVEGRLQDRIGLVVFAGEAFTLCPTTNDYDLLYKFLEEIQPQIISSSGTAIGSALAVAVNRLRESTVKSKVIVLLSDGENTAGGLDPITAAKLAQAFNIKIYSISVGTEQRTEIVTDSTTHQVQRLSDENTLQEIAQITNGFFFRAINNAGLQNVFDKINQLEKVKVKTQYYQDIKDYYRVYLYWAVFLLLFSLFLKVIFVANVLED
jgi:Ca-activated chloride channel homolog